MNPSTVAPSTPILRDSEQRLAKIQRQLEDMFRSLDLMHDEIEVASEAARSKGQPEIANVLGLGVCNRLFRQLKSLTNVIERLGGRTDLSEVEEQLADDQASDNGKGGMSHATNE